ncbi:MAG: sigma-70 family RNA polymerase sigma factor [Bacilli bacterium]|nr:sigma-70 family RNA polymerase sigma factor [Bacilli bacterium]MDD3304673.1 sigma-70 family RNA polymerase sigma factor [Bacilli bacterium]MDD4053275.1 sigma-70 family RNA polymerase sigma factor [Bacilli bacterium]MDD4411385.1 sigma-70 family RNA polymerase sigma factor [Bacilli bacterium]
MNVYQEYNDFELLYLTCSEDEEAYDILYNKYKPIVEIKAKKYLRFAQGKGLDMNDLMQEGMIGLSEAIRDFKIQKNVKFSTFANMCIERQINSAIIKANRIKYRSLNESLSLDEKTNIDDRPLIETVRSTKDSDPIRLLLNLETQNEFYDKVKEILSPFELDILYLRLKSFEYKEIAVKLNKSYKSIDSGLQRIKNKLRRMFEK